MLVRLKPRGQRERSAEEIIADLRPKLHEAAPAPEIEFVQLLQDMLGDLEGAPTPIEVKIFGDDPAVLEQTRRAGRSRCSARSTASSTWSACSAATRKSPGRRSHGGGPRRADGRTGRAAALGRVAGRCGDRPAAAGSTRAGPGASPGLGAVRSRAARRRRCCAPATASSCRCRASRTARVRTASRELLRENLRGMALVTARLEGRDLGSAVAEIRPAAGAAEAAGRLHATRWAGSTSRSGRRSASC